MGTIEVIKQPPKLPPLVKVTTSRLDRINATLAMLRSPYIRIRRVTPPMTQYSDYTIEYEELEKYED